ncbi:hypothetical protein BH23CHL6_BH23CHL6_06610 [soil metagenome]
MRRLLPLAELARICALSLTAAAPPSPASIALVLSDDAQLAELNARHMGRPGPTDVLSFPLLELSVGAAAEHHEPVFRLAPGQRLHLGDIVVSVERAIEQAEMGRGGQTGNVSWSPAEELRLLVVHGVLHVCGWDHENTQSEASMRTLERGILDFEYA